MNVEFRCPVCKARLFAPPTAQGKGGKAVMQCSATPKCNQVHFEQVEEFGGDSTRYDFIDEKRQQHHTDPDEAALFNMQGDDEKKDYLRGRILEVTGKAADKRLGWKSLYDDLKKALAEKQPLTIDTGPGDND